MTEDRQLADKTPSASGIQRVANITDSFPAASDELGEDLVRLRKAARVGLFIWPLFALVDVLIPTLAEPGRIWVYLVIRAAGWSVIAVSFMGLRAVRRPTTRRLIAWDTYLMAGLAFLISLRSIELRGIASPTAFGIITVMFCRCALVQVSWRRSVVPLGTAAAAFPLTILGLCAFVPHMRAQLSDTGAVTELVAHALMVLCSAALAAMTSHGAWALRRARGRFEHSPQGVGQGAEIGPYVLLEKLGEGGMGQVWRARHGLLERTVALKLITPKDPCDVSLHRFAREVRLTSQLNHPNIVTVFDFGRTADGVFYYAMELVDGVDLSALVKSEGAQPVGRVIHLLKQIGAALAEAHARGLVHRDIKPANVIVRRDRDAADVAQLLDFGLVKSSEDAQETLTREGDLAGTPAFMAPESIESPESVDARADVYAVGALAYYLLTGEHVFSGATVVEVLFHHMYSEPVPPSARLGRPIRPELERLVLRCLAKRPDARPESAEALLEELSQLGFGRWTREDAAAQWGVAS